MQFKLVLTFFVPMLVALVSAAPSSRTGFTARGESQPSTCNNSGTHCCNSVVAANQVDSGVTSLLGFAGINVDELMNNIGLGCSSMSGGASCMSNVVCCDNDAFGGLIAVGCTSMGAAM